MMVDAESEEYSIVQRLPLKRCPRARCLHAWEYLRIRCCCLGQNLCLPLELVGAAHRLVIERFEALDERVRILSEHQGIGTQSAVVLIFRGVCPILLLPIRQGAILANETCQTLIKTDVAFKPDSLVQHFVEDRIDQKSIVISEHTR